MRETTAKEPEERPADYREMYLVMARAMEKCARELVEAQRRCEELYLRSTEERKRGDRESGLLFGCLAYLK